MTDRRISNVFSTVLSSLLLYIRYPSMDFGHTSPDFCSGYRSIISRIMDGSGFRITSSTLIADDPVKLPDESGFFFV
jgi:hypothetical protein